MASAISSGVLATGSTTTTNSGKSFVNSIQLFGDGTNAPSVTLYDNTAGSGKIVARLIGVASTTYMDFVPPYALRCDAGLTVVVAGVGASAIVGYGAAS